MSTVAATDTTFVSQARSTSSGESLISSDFDTWLTLLTAQLRNQDPFDPVDSTEYTAQLAQFSAVEQQVRTNDLLASLVSLGTSSDMATMAGWVGMEVRASVPASYEGVPIRAFASAEPTASRAELVVRDDRGKEVNRYQISLGDSQVEWNGNNVAGYQAPWGTYEFDVVSYDSSERVVGTSTAEIFAEVSEVRMIDGVIQLVLDNGTKLPANAVSAVRPGG